MSAYSTPAAMRTFVGEALLVQFSADTGVVVNDTRLTEVLTAASDIIDGYIGTRYVVPATDAAALRTLAPHCNAIAKNILLGRLLANRFDQASGGVDLCFEAFAWLKRVADRRASLPGGTELITTAAGSANAVAGSDLLIFGDPNDPHSGGAFL